ncbi:MAG TPA: T9SS type A sorting domain-containing protein [Bacteroidales bacterium]|nr:T9SS type A sorting domain-containing protein [Bacteroidales bacterium]
MRKALLLFFLCGSLVTGISQVHINVTVTTPPLPVAFAGHDTLINPGSQLILLGSVSGGTAPYTYRWSPGHLLNDSTSLTPVFTATVTTIFTLYVTDVNGCEAEDEVVVSVSTVGIPAYGMDHVRVFPNPARGQVQLSGLTAVASPFSLELLSIMGEELVRQQIPAGSDAVSLDVSGISTGIYLLRLFARDGWAVYKLSIQ